MTLKNYVLKKNSVLIYKGEDYSDVERLLPETPTSEESSYDLVTISASKDKIEIEYKYRMAKKLPEGYYEQKTPLSDSGISSNHFTLVGFLSGKEDLDDVVRRAVFVAENYEIRGVMPGTIKN